jgi:GNAT superfamily N-acetyltransferase
VSAPSVDVIRWGGERARAGRWRGEVDVAFIAPLPDTPLPSAEFLRRCLDTLAAKGYRRVVTGALSPLEQTGFLAAGFDVEERLRLLGIDLGGPLPSVPPGVPVRRAGRRRQADVLAVDRRAFTPFWQFDRIGLRDALKATPAVHFRIAVPDRGAVTGYAICGRSGSRGFVQRLAVDPGAQGTGTGRRLLLEGLHWLRRRGAARALVNTQMANHKALSLYTQTGFEEEPIGLSVLSAGIP